MAGKDFFVGFIFGAAAGVLISLKAEGKTSEDLAKYYQEIKDRVTEEAGRIKGITKETYDHVVNSVVTGYQEARQITSREAGVIREELKSGFDRIRKAHEETQA